MRRPASEEEVNLRPLRILRNPVPAAGRVHKSDAVKNFIRFQAQGLDHDVLAVMYRDSQHRLIANERPVRGTLAQTSV
jgi:DNA repair protein RadC